MKKIACNPLNVPYRYQKYEQDADRTPETLAREAADPSMILFKGKYYIFPSMTMGVWVSEDMAHWKFAPLPENLPFGGYAPDVCVIGDEVFFCASDYSRKGAFYHTKDILNGPYERIEVPFMFSDPCLFEDTDGRRYFYWGCNDVTPIWGIELDVKTMQPIGKPTDLFVGHPDRYGFERKSENHETMRKPHVEGAWMTKYNGKYYLQYACPGTEFNIYADGVYESDSPLGPFTFAKNNPYSYHPGGYFPGAGHGSTMQDVNGSWWHAATMRISINHMFERRVGLWRAGFDADGVLFCDQRYGDWPFDADAAPWTKPEWFLLSYRKRMTASSHTAGHEPELAADENVQTLWQAASAEKGEWLQMDLGAVCSVNAVQINFGDCRIPVSLIKEPYISDYRTIEKAKQFTRWVLEGSADGEHFTVLADKSEAETDLPHDLLVFEEAKELRYLKLTVKEVPYHQAACISGLRVFGRGRGEAPEKPQFTAVRVGDLDMDVTFSAKNATACNVLWGYSPEKLYHSYLVFGKQQQRIGALIAGEPVFVRVDAVNENGITEGDVTALESGAKIQ